MCQVHSLSLSQSKEYRLTQTASVLSRAESILSLALLGVQKEDGVHFGGKVMKCPGDAAALFPFLWI